MQFYFIRHAQSVNNALWERTGSSKGRSVDPEVTDLGKRQAELLAGYLSRNRLPSVNVNGRDPQNSYGFGITHLYCSLMVRAVYTAHCIAEAIDLPVYAWEDLHEEGGIYQEDEETGEKIGQPGRNRAYFETYYPRLVLPETLGDEGWWNRPYEAYELRLPRAQRFLDELLRRHGNTQDRVAVVSHGGFYKHFMSALIGKSDLNHLWFVMNNCGITRIDFEQEIIELVYQNRADFLPGELITL